MEISLKISPRFACPVRNLVKFSNEVRQNKNGFRPFQKGKYEKYEIDILLSLDKI